MIELHLGGVDSCGVDGFVGNASGVVFMFLEAWRWI